MRGNSICLSGLGLLLLLTSISFAQEKTVKNPKTETQPERATPSVNDKFVGSWRLVAIEGSQFPGRDRIGLIMYDKTGHMSVHIMSRDRPKFASGNRQQGSQEETKAALDGYIAYFGPYEINEAEGVIIHHLEGSIFPNEIGRDNIRYYEFSGDRLTLIPTNRIDGKLAPKSSARIRIIWERVK